MNHFLLSTLLTLLLITPSTLASTQNLATNTPTTISSKSNNCFLPSNDCDPVCSKEGEICYKGQCVNQDTISTTQNTSLRASILVKNNLEINMMVCFGGLCIGTLIAMFMRAIYVFICGSKTQLEEEIEVDIVEIEDDNKQIPLISKNTTQDECMLNA